MKLIGIISSFPTLILWAKEFVEYLLILFNRSWLIDIGGFAMN
jgi:hypothetical protein